MWLFTKFGFFSIVQKPDDKKSGTLTIRARAKRDLESLRENYLPGMSAISEHVGTDYKYRVKIPRTDLATVIHQFVMDLDYGNFKSEVAKCQGQDREKVYHRVWHELLTLENDKPPVSQSRSTSGSSNQGLKSAYGGVLVDSLGRILLRKPVNEFDGYAWTFAKGRPEGHSTPEETALTEVLEETGYRAEILVKVPGSFPGGTSVTEYYLMAPLGEPQEFDRRETELVTWVTLQEATEHIGQTTNVKGRERDLAVLKDAVGAYKTWARPQGLGLLFRERPPTWGLRGDAFLWVELEKRFVGQSLPRSDYDLYVLLASAFQEATGVPLMHREPVFIERFNHGGMSSGHVSIDFWRATALPLLQARYNGLRTLGL